MSIPGASRVHLASVLTKTGSWAALLKAGGRGAHWVVVDGVSRDGIMRVRDPGGWRAELSPEAVERLWRYTEAVYRGS